VSGSDTTLAQELAGIVLGREIEGVEASIVVAPESAQDVARVLTTAASHGVGVVPVGSGSTLAGTEAGIALSTERLAGIIDYQPDDLTVVVGAGTRLIDLEAELAERWHTAVLPEGVPDRTVGGVVASGSSGYRRLKYGPTRDRVLEVTMATGYGEVIRAGGRLVKNVTGYDIPRLMTGSLGSLGVITSVCLKLWPASPHRVTVAIEDPSAAVMSVYKPMAVLETSAGSSVYLEGDEATVDRQVAALGGDASAGFQWPQSQRSLVVVSLRVPPRYTKAAIRVIGELSPDWFVAQHGVGLVDCGFAVLDAPSIDHLRRWAEDLHGSLVVETSGLTFLERWGTPPSTLSIQKRMKDLFDPAGVCHPGALPGGL